MATAPIGLRPNANLTNFAISYSQTKEMQTLMVPGIVPVTKRSDRYLIWNKGDLLRSEMKRRVAGTEAETADARVSNDTYFCERWALKRRLTDEDLDEYGSLAEAEQEIANYLTEQAYLTMVAQFVASLMVSTVWGTGVGGIANQTGAATAASNQFIQWDRPSGVPVQDIARASRLVQASIGRLPTNLITGPKVFDDLCNNADIIERIKYTTDTSAAATLLARLFKVNAVNPLRATSNTAAENATAVMAQTAGLVALLGYFPEGASKMTPAAAKVFSFAKYGGFPANAPTIKKWFDEKTSSFWYEGEMYFDVKVTAPDAAVFFITAVQADA